MQAVTTEKINGRYPIYSFGYQKRTVQEVFEFCKLRKATLIDIRYSADSKREEFKQDNLKNLFRGRYCHVPELGNTAYRSGEISISDMTIGLEIVACWCEDMPIALMCVCPKYETCHRKLVNDALWQHFRIGVVEVDGQNASSLFPDEEQGKQSTTIPDSYSE